MVSVSHRQIRAYWLLWCFRMLHPETLGLFYLGKNSNILW